MKLLAQLRKKQRDLFAEMRSLQDAVGSEERDFTAEEETRFKDLESEFEKVGRSIEREERMSSYEQSTGGQYDSEPAFEARSKSGDGQEDLEMRGETRAKKGPFLTLGEQLMAVIRSDMKGGSIDKRLLELRAPTGMNEAMPQEGGYLVQKDHVTDLTNSAFETGILASRVRKIPVGPNSNGVKFNLVDETSRANGSRYSGIQAYWVGEGQQKPNTKPKLRQAEMQFKKLVGMIYLTDELMQDAVALEAWVRSMFAEEFGFQLDDAIVNGTGVGMPLGILNSPALVSVSGESMQAANALFYRNFVNMVARMSPRSLANAVWLVNSGVIPPLALMPWDETATYKVPAFVPSGGASGEGIASIWTRPIIPIEQAAAPGTVGDIIFADLNQYMMIQRGPMEAATSIHVRFDYDETALRFVLRVDGQPIPRSALTPYKGSLTTSPFVALSTRNGS